MNDCKTSLGKRAEDRGEFVFRDVSSRMNFKSGFELHEPASVSIVVTPAATFSVLPLSSPIWRRSLEVKVSIS